MPRRFKVGYQIHPQHCTVDEIRTAVRRADELGADTVWVWDHMYPLYGPPDGSSHECWTLLAAIAVETRRAHIGALVCSTSYRNAEFMVNELRVPVPAALMERMRKADSGDAARAEGTAIAQEMVSQIRNVVDGVQLSAPFGRYGMAVEVMQALGSRGTAA